MKSREVRKEEKKKPAKSLKERRMEKRNKEMERRGIGVSGIA